MWVIFLITFIIGVILISIGYIFELDLCVILSVFMIIIGIIGFLICFPKRTYKTIIVITAEQEQTFHNCDYDTHDTYVEIWQDEEKILIYNPVEIKVK